MIHRLACDGAADARCAGVRRRSGSGLRRTRFSQTATWAYIDRGGSGRSSGLLDFSHRALLGRHRLFRGLAMACMNAHLQAVGSGRVWGRRVHTAVLHGTTTAAPWVCGLLSPLRECDRSIGWIAGPARAGVLAVARDELPASHAASGRRASVYMATCNGCIDERCPRSDAQGATRACSVGVVASVWACEASSLAGCDATTNTLPHLGVPPRRWSAQLPVGAGRDGRPGSVARSRRGPGKVD